MVRAFGSLINRIGEESGSPKPEIGMGATITHFSDRDAGTVVKFWEEPSKVSGFPVMYRYVQVQCDIATRADKNGMSDAQDYTYKPNPKGEISTWRCVLRDGKQMTPYARCIPSLVKGRWKKGDLNGMYLGSRDAYHDYSF